MAENWDGGYYAVIPAEVRYDPDLKPNAKLLYGELTSLCNQKGYCWATNEHFAELYGLSVGTISRLIAQLEQKGYIRSKMAATPRGSERRIYAGMFVVSQADDDGGIDEKRKTPLDEKRKGGIAENGKQNNKAMNNKQEYPPLPPKGGAGRKEKKAELEPEVKAMLREYVGGDRELTEAMAAYIDVRLSPKSKAVNTPRAIRAALSQLDKLSGGNRETKVQILLQSAGAGWAGVFALRGNGPPGKSRDRPRRVREEVRVW